MRSDAETFHLNSICPAPVDRSPVVTRHRTNHPAGISQRPPRDRCPELRIEQ
ncbi:MULTISPECIES: hypothetical protein [Limnospira]|uniref:Uncharacterized protein n=1 Tax=Limnospira fusiformis PMC 851.14 TaxID=2219512 RepID=A0ABU9ENG0_LIMFS|nr:hypothetical protein [Limnospira maxima]